LDEEEEEAQQENEAEEPEAAKEQEDAEAEPETTEGDDYDWDEYLNAADGLYGHKAQVEGGDDEDRRELPLPARESITEHLREQLVFLHLGETDELVAEQVIGSIDEDGYLRRPLESIVDDLMFNYGVAPTEEDVE